MLSLSVLLSIPPLCLICCFLLTFSFPPPPSPPPDFFSLLTHFPNHGWSDFVRLLIALLKKQWSECSVIGEEFKNGAATAKACGQTAGPVMTQSCYSWSSKLFEKLGAATVIIQQQKWSCTAPLHLKQPCIVHSQVARSKTIGSDYKWAKQHSKLWVLGENLVNFLFK